MNSIDLVYPLLDQKSQRIAIVMHQKPDADAMGSSLALSLFLKAQGHETIVISPTNWANYLNWMQESNLVLDYEKKKQQVETQLASVDMLFCLDFNHFGRTKRMAEFLAGLTCTKVLIDHHQEPQVEAFQYGVSNTAKCSTCEMIFDFITNSGKQHLVTKEIAECLYAGAMTDTGSFRFSSTTSSVHIMVAALIEKGAVPNTIHENLFDNYLENRLRFMGHVLSNRMEVFYDLNTVLITIPNSDLVKYEIQTGDTEGLVNLPQSIQGIKLVAIIIDRHEEIKMSFRSKGAFDCNTFARKYFGGGGHYNASGGGSKKKLKDAVNDFMFAIQESEDQLK